ncbi:sphingolipid delta-4 desaturase, partial [Modicella reniformis]
MGVDNETTFTWQELAKHNTAGDLLVAIRGNVYDVTRFLKRHPGGMDTLLLGAGRDVTP